MKIRVINPNTTLSMTEKIGAAARATASLSVTIEALSPDKGPVSIEGPYDEAYSVPGMLELVREGGADGYIIACFDDPGLDAARAITAAPVIGIAEAAMHAATMLGASFTIITTLSRAIPVMENLALKYGFERHLRRVRAADFPVLALEDPESGARTRLEHEIEHALNDDAPEAILLGCAGMADLTKALSSKYGLPVIDGVSAATALCEAMVRLGLPTSKRGFYAWPRHKPYAGDFARFAPPEH
ncbi:MAG: aspartate/glutamate racemase family protein [Pseudomonadota bacterium]